MHFSKIVCQIALNLANVRQLSLHLFGLEMSTVAMAMIQMRKHKYGDDEFTIYC